MKHIVTNINQFINDSIKKVENYTLDDYKKDKNNGIIFEPIGNAHFFFLKFIKSGDENRRKRSPHNISYEQMNNVFGNPNFLDDYKEDYFWIFEFDNKRFAVCTNTREGSNIYEIFSDNIDRIYDKQFSIDIEKFYNQLFSQI
jgi:hypothetical protein